MRCHFGQGNSRSGAGLEPVMAFCLDLDSEVELDHLRGLGSENRAIPRAIGLQFVGWWETIHLQPFEDRHKLYLAIAGILMEYLGVY